MKRANNNFLFAIILPALFGSLTLSGQTLTATVDREKIMIGEKILLTIKLQDVKPGDNTVRWVELPDTINHFETVEKGKIDTIRVDNIVNYQQVINITSFDSGRWQIPSLSIQTNSASSTLSTKPIAIEVFPVDVSHLKDYHDIKEIIEVQDESSRLITILLIIITLMALGIVIWLTRRRKQLIITETTAVKTLDPLEWALAELYKLKHEDLPAKGLAKQFYQRMTDISRQFFYRQFSHSALHQTTDEWMLELQNVRVGQQTKTKFFQFIRLADTVKFAKYLPPPEEYEYSLNAAANMFNSVATLKFADPVNTNVRPR